MGDPGWRMTLMAQIMEQAEELLALQESLYE
jgi:hypothetical protein